MNPDSTTGLERAESGVAAFAGPVEGSVDLLLVAGEHSGDEHAAEIVIALKAARPKLKIACLGGPKLEAAGAQLLYDLTALSVVGFVEVLKHYSLFKAIFNRTLEWVEQHKPEQICFVDYPGFNLRLAEQLWERGLSRKGGGTIELSYYIGPQIWAWKAKRRFKMARVLDRVGVIFPFEVDCYADTELPVEFVGHPFVGEDYKLPFKYAADGPVLLLPGSRSTPVGRIFPLLLDGFAKALETRPDLEACVVYPSTQILEQLKAIVASYPDLRARISFRSNEQHAIPASAVLMSSGTMSLAVALSAIPGAIVYRLHPLSYWMGRFLVKIPYIGIANLLLNRDVHQEYIQGAATAKRLCAEILLASSPEAAAVAKIDARELRKILQPESVASAAEWLARTFDQRRESAG